MMSSRLLDQFEIGSATLRQDFGAGSRPIKKRAESGPVSGERRVHTAKTVSVNGKSNPSSITDPALYAIPAGTKVEVVV
jgi:hypothetical protein